MITCSSSSSCTVQSSNDGSFSSTSFDDQTVDLRDLNDKFSVSSSALLSLSTNMLMSAGIICVVTETSLKVAFI